MDDMDPVSDSKWLEDLDAIKKKIRDLEEERKINEQQEPSFLELWEEGKASLRKAWGFIRSVGKKDGKKDGDQ